LERSALPIAGTPRVENGNGFIADLAEGGRNRHYIHFRSDAPQVLRVQHWLLTRLRGAI
jgi:hypothetical protein